MRMWVGILVVTAATLCNVTKIFGQNNSCLYIYPDSISADANHLNKDSVALDTCKASATYNHFYSKRYDIYFKANIFDLSYANPDSILIVHWDDIDTAYHILRDSFQAMYDRWGSFYFQKTHPDDTLFAYEGFKLIFDNYQLAYGYDSLVSYGGIMNDLDTLWTKTGMLEAFVNPPIPPPDYVHEEILEDYILWSIGDDILSLRLNPIKINRVQVKIFDCLGRCILNTSGYTQSTNGYSLLRINIHTLPHGVYFLIFENMPYRVKFYF